ncbi:transglycosylase SLT domain-containing protein [Acetobacter fallax]|uniref:Transglycosylase SLT domain-containing protein n=2 Tax=Acetobacter fallax TaxID=1737473 RepID=A0ABX0KAL1_9PROT|nr:transglycosylase SLT domain-containing protein [Acetobacter fallax]NHO33439.1 transglycosylase SLT domain-containing protein [Acetobacter fallax]NHO37082.1 transglycosylase SLT domain-containing protein [Acetobacter fallax]
MAARPTMAAPMSCEQAATIVEHALDLPQGLLAIIGRVESGNHPLAVDVSGTPIQFARLDLAVDAVETMLHSGAFGARPHLDVGCFQINLGWHPDAFASVESSFDPLINGVAAGQLLRRLHVMTGDWHKAVARYHAASQEGARYASHVFRNYEALPKIQQSPIPVATLDPVSQSAPKTAWRRYAGQLWIATATGHGITVFEPSSGHWTSGRRTVSRPRRAA